jgi:succinate dehydrogenase hydrophobic anchor subunit
MSFRNYLAGAIFAVLLIWGPIDHSWPAWLAIRSGYLILVPLVVWFLVGWLWNHWQPNKKLEITLERILSGTICIAIFVLAVLEAISETHIGNTLWIRTRDGMEAVGDDIVLQGPDWGNVFVLVLIAVVFLWLSVKKGPKASDS